LRAVGGRNVATTAIATRGDRLALYRFHVMSAERRPGDFETEAIVLNELGATGRLGHGVVFAPDELVAAVAELDRRYLADEGAAFEGIVANTVRFVRGYADSDWLALRDLIADDVAFVDHRPASMPSTRSADEVVRNIRALKELSPTSRCTSQPSTALRRTRYSIN